MNKLYSFFFCTAFLFNSHLASAQLNSSFEGALPLINGDDIWPLEYLKGETTDMIVYQDTLYAVGTFGDFNGLALNGILKWDGTHVHAMNSPFDIDASDFAVYNGVMAINVFQDHLVVAVNVEEGSSRVYTYNGAEWTVLGDELGDYLIYDLIEWNGQLYCSGQSGNPLNVLNESNEWVSANFPGNVVVVDMEVFNGAFYCVTGTSERKIWKNEGDGFVQILTDFQSNTTYSLTVDNNELYALGNYEDASTSSKLLKLSDAFPQFIETLGFNNVSGYFSFGGVQYFCEEYQSSSMFIYDEQRRAHCFLKKSPDLGPDNNSKTIVYKNEIYITETLWNQDQGWDQEFAAAMVVFKPNEFTTISNDQQYFSKRTNFGIVNNVGATGGVGEANILFDPNLMNASPFYVSGMLLSGKSQSEQRASAHFYNGYLSNFFPGPYTENYNIETLVKYNRAWSVTQEEIDNHISQGGSSSYIIPLSILEWPGNGDAANGESHMLAPFVDVNQNSWYEPEQGDYPMIRGREAMFWVQHGRETTRLTSPMRVDMHLMAYVTEDEGHNDLCLFLHTTVINRSNETYDSLRVGLFNDFDLGNGMDDHIGCDSLLSVAYVYNGDNLDEDGPSVSGYGSEVPAFGAVFLSENMESNMLYWNGSNPISGTPENTSDLYNYMQGKFRNGEYEDPFSIGSSGPMMYGDSPCGLGQDNEIDFGIPTGSRRLISAGELHTLLPDESLCFDFAYYFKPSSGDNIETLCAMLEDIPAIHAFYEEQNFNCSYINRIDENTQELNWNIYPNPTSDMINIEIEGVQQRNDVRVTVIDMQGRNAMIPSPITQSGLITLNLTSLSTGAYMLKVEVDGRMYSKVVTRN